MTSLPISIIILTYNEEKNILACLESIQGISDDIIIVDSDSIDKTLEVAKPFNCRIYKHGFENYSKQRNWAFANIDLKYPWILNMDADHRLTPEFRQEVKFLFNKGIPDNINGFMASRRTIFLGKWIKHGGHYPVYHGVLFRKGYGICEEKEYDQHFIINGDSKQLKGDVIDIITDSLDTFISRHNRWATLEARDILSVKLNHGSNVLLPNKNGTAMEKRRYQRLRYYRYPMFLRVYFYYTYRYFLKLGFLDGKEGMIFHFLQCFWFRFLVDSKIYELKQIAIKNNSDKL